MKITLIVPQVKTQPEARPKRCPQCSSPYLARHGTVAKALKDIKLNRVRVVRYRCSNCGVTFRHYPEGVRRARQSKRLIVLAALMQALGLSCSVTSHLLRLEEAPISKSTVWRDVQEVGIALRRRPWTGKARVIGADETWVKLKGQGVALGLVVDAQSGETIWVEVLVELDSAAFVRWLRKVADRVGAEVLVTDDLSTYKPVAQRLGLKHQVCLAHVRKNVTKRLKKLAGQEEVKEATCGRMAIRDIIRELPPWGERAIRELAKVLRRDTPWRMFLRELADKYKSLRLHLEEEGVPATNNVAERAIGRSKVRYKTVRGFKSEAGMLNLVALTQWLYTPNEVHDTRNLVA